MAAPASHNYARSPRYWKTTEVAVSCRPLAQRCFLSPVSLFLRPPNRLPCLLLLAFLAGLAPLRAATAVVSFSESPSVVSNTYNGLITLQIYGLTNGVTNVVVQKFLDVNTNGLIDSGDPLVQQFRLAVGHAAVFTNEATMRAVTVTNFMPGDANPATNQITAPLNFQDGDFAQTLVGQYLYKVSSPSGLFSPVTNLFVVTNAFFSSYVTGAVQNAASLDLTNIPNAIVLVCVAQNGPITVQAGTVANKSGVYAIRVPPGNYFLAAAKSNFVDDVTSSLALTALTNGVTISLNPAATNITGRIVDAATSNGLAGVSGMVISTNDVLSLYFTDTNGNFTAPVVTGFSEVPVDPFAAAFQGYLTSQADLLLNVSNKLVKFTNAIPAATAIFYGVVSNSAAAPIPGLYLYASDNAGHQSYGMTDQNGNYVLDALAGTNEWQISILATNNPGLTNANVFSPAYLPIVSFQPGQAVQQNFTLQYAPYTIGGTVKDLNGNPIAGVELFATNATYQAFTALTSSSGSYTLYVSPGTWTVGINAASLQSLGYSNVPADQMVTISTANATVNFSVTVCGQIQILTTALPNGFVGTYYETNLQATSCSQNTWQPAYGITLTSLYDQTNVTYPPGTPIYSESKLIGYVQTYFTFGVANNAPYTTNITATETLVGQSWEFYNLSATVNVTGPITNQTQIQFGATGTSWTAQPTTQSGSSYSTTLTLAEYPSSGDGIYFSGSYTCTPGSLMTKAGSPSNTVARIVGNFLSQPTPGNSVNVPSSIAYANLDNLVVWIPNGKTPGQYLISADGPQSTNLPPGISLYPDGTLAGAPTGAGTNGIFNFSVAAEDQDGDATVQPLSMFVYPAATINGPSGNQIRMLESSNVFQMQINGVISGLNYTLLMSTNLASTNWIPIYSTNTVSTNSIVVPDTSATNSARFYRIQMVQ